MGGRFITSTAECEACKSTDVGVLETRPGSLGSRRRRRVCNACDHRWTTYEIDERTMNQMLRCLDVVESINGALSRLNRSPNTKLKAKATVKAVSKALDKATSGPPLPCTTCPQAAGERCGLGYPEGFTIEAIGCTIPTITA